MKFTQSFMMIMNKLNSKEKAKLKEELYDYLLSEYNELSQNEKEDFSKGLTMLYQNEYFKKHKKANIRFDNYIVFELYDYSRFLINTINTTGPLNFKTIVSKSNLDIIENAYENEFSLKSLKIDNKIMFSFFKVTEFMIKSIVSKVALSNEEFISINNNIEAGLIAVQNRFNVDFNKTIPERNNFKSTISLKHNHKLSITKLRRNLIGEKFIIGDKNIDVKFEAIFGNYEVKESDRIVWKESIHALKIFLDFVKGETDIKQKLQLYKTATKCFVKEDYQEFEYQKIQNSNGSSHLLPKIKEIVQLSLINSRALK